MYSGYELLWIFFVYALLGWCTEVSYAALVTGKFVNRGFLNGPVCPIYGFGAAIIFLCLEPLKQNLLLLFLGSVLLTSLLELAAGFVLEKLFHQRWWDYSDEPFNLGGYICLRFSIAWGLIGLFVVDLLHPTVMLLVRLLPPYAGRGPAGLLRSGHSGGSGGHRQRHRQAQPPAEADRRIGRADPGSCPTSWAKIWRTRCWRRRRRGRPGKRSWTSRPSSCGSMRRNGRKNEARSAYGAGGSGSRSWRSWGRSWSMRWMGMPSASAA